MGLGDLTGGLFSSVAYGVSGDGSVVVGSSNATSGASPNEAFLWDEAHGLRNLNLVLGALGLDLTGWTLEQARAISEDGRTIVGIGHSPSGGNEAWIAVIPEPSTALLMGLSPLAFALLGTLLGLVGWRRLRE